MAKHGLGGLTKQLAFELGRHDITVNSVAPGMVATPMTELEDEDPSEHPKPKFPIPRPGDAREIANITFVSRQLGHTSSQVTLGVYAHLVDRDEQARRTREMLEAALGDIVRDPLTPFSSESG